VQVRALQVEADATRLLRMRVRDDAPAPPLAAHGAICAPTVGDATPHLQLQPPRLGLDTNAVWVDAGQMMTTYDVSYSDPPPGALCVFVPNQPI